MGVGGHGTTGLPRSILREERRAKTRGARGGEKGTFCEREQVGFCTLLVGGEFEKRIAARKKFEEKLGEIEGGGKKIKHVLSIGGTHNRNRKQNKKKTTR